MLSLYQEIDANDAVSFNAHCERRINWAELKKNGMRAKVRADLEKLDRWYNNGARNERGGRNRLIAKIAEIETELTALRRVLEPPADPLSVCDLEVLSYGEYTTLLNLAADNGDSTVPCEPESSRKRLGLAGHVTSTDIVPQPPAEESDSDHPIDNEEEEPIEPIDNEKSRYMLAFEMLGYNFFESERMAEFSGPPPPKRTNLDWEARRKFFARN